MRLFLDIFTNITLPILAVAAVGWFAQRRLALNVETLSRLLVNLLLPCFLLNYFATVRVPVLEVWPTAWFTILQFTALTLIGWLVALIFRVPAGQRSVVALALAFPNTGNFGLPLAQLAFPAELIVHQAVIVSLQTAIMVPVAALILATPEGKRRSVLGPVLRSPMIWAVAAGVALRWYEVTLPPMIERPLAIIGSAYAAVALLTLGGGLAVTAHAIRGGAVALMVVLKLLVAPALTWGLAVGLGFSGGLLDLLVVAAAAPAALLLVIFTLQYNRHPGLASGAVFLSTILSPLTVTLWVLATRLY